MADATLVAVSGTLSTLSSALSLCPIPALQYIPTAAVAIISVAQTVIKNKEDAEELALYIGNLTVAIWRPLQNDHFRLKLEQEQQLDLLLREMGRVKESMKKLASRNLLKRTFTSAVDQVQLAGFQSRIKSVLDIFQLESNLALRAQVDRVETAVEDVKGTLTDDGLQYLIDKLGTGDFGAADVAVDNKGRTCTKGTRVKHLQEIETWAVDPAFRGKRFRWVKGVAGSGKSTVIATIEKRLEPYNALGATFHFSRENPVRNKRVIPEVARQLAYWQGGLLRQHIAEAVKSSSTIDHLTLDDQYEMLIRQPLQHLPSTAPPLVFIFDALDETEEDIATALLERITSDHATLPPFVKFIITSRVEPHLHARFNSEPLKAAVEHHPLDADDAELKRKDIDIYFRDLLPRQVELCGVEGSDWPGEAMRAILVDMSQGLFIWAFTAALFIGKRDPEYYLGILINAQTAFTGLYALYSGVLEHSFPTGADSPHTLGLLRDVLGSLVVARTPLNIYELGCFISPETVDRRDIHKRIRLHVLARLQSVLAVPGIDTHDPSKDEKPIQFLHKSFVDFLATESNASPRFFVNQADHQERMARACFLLMRSLKRNICNLKDSSKLNYEVEELEEMVDNHISPVLRYACRYWPDHVARVRRQNTDILSLLQDFCQSRLLYWIEVLSLLGQAKDGIPMIGVIMEWLRTDGSNIFSDLTVADLLLDIRQFLNEYMEPISTSAMHIYISALPLVPFGTALARHDKYSEMSKGGLVVLRGLERQWQRTVWVGRGHSESVRCLAFSPDGTILASGSNDNNLRFWDAKTGASLGEALQGHSKSVVCLAFSPDGTTVASGSRDNTLRFWDVKTGASMGEALPFDSETIACLAFSSDGTTLASGSYDNTLRLWDVKTGLSLRKALEGHFSGAICFAFSPDGTTLASGSNHSTIRLRDATTGASLGEALQGHPNWVTCLAFSSNGTTLASGSADNTIRLWDVTTGASLGEALRGHSESVACLAFSPDGSTLASCSWDTTLLLWDAKTGASLGGVLRGHSNEVNCLAFSPNGSTIASGSDDKTIRLWDVKTGASLGEAPQGHSKWVSCLAFSPDGTTLACASSDNTIQLWDAATGASLGEALEGHSDEVNYLDFSPNGSTLASRSDYKTFWLWDVKTGAPLGEALHHPDSVACLAFSPDGTTLASGSADHTIRLWDATTGASLGEALQGHSESVDCLAFSPDGSTLASASSENTIQLWDAATGVSLREPLEGHSKWVTCLAFSPDSTTLASGSADDTLRLWDVKTGASLGEALHHPDSVACLAFSPDSTTLASGAGAWNHALRLWDAKTGASICETLKPPSSGVCSLRIAFLLLGDTLILETQGGDILDVASRRWITNSVEHPVGCNHVAHILPSQPFRIEASGWIKGPGGRRLLWLPPKLRPLRGAWEDEYDADMLYAFGNRLIVQSPLLPILDISALR